MNLRLSTVTAGICLVALATAPARADVLEIGDGGEAKWIVGPQAIDSNQVLSSAASELTQVPSDVSVPAEAVALPYVHAGPVPAAYSAKVAELAARYDLSPALIEALVWQESRWRANAVSPAGARGRVIDAGGIPRIRETQTYVAAVMGRLSNHSRSPE